MSERSSPQKIPDSLMRNSPFWLAGFFVVAFAISAVMGRFENQLPGVVGVYALQALLVLLCGGLWLKGWRPLYRLSLQGFGLLLLLLGVYLGALKLLDLALVDPEVRLRVMSFRDLTWTYAPTQLLLAPIFEELFFRDYLFRALKERMGSVFRAVVFSSLFFMLAHLNIQIGAFLLGVICCALLIRFQSVWPAIIFHFVSNFSLYFFPVFYPHLYKALFDWELFRYFYGGA